MIDLPPLPPRFAIETIRDGAEIGVVYVPVWTAEGMRTYGEACARAALEAASSISPDSLSVPIEGATPADIWAEYRSAIRALKDKP